MYFSGLILTLAATASAVDLRAWSGASCNGSFRACVGLNPNVCCSFTDSASSGLLSISVNAIPSSWRIRAEAYTGGGCRYIANQQDSNGNTDLCLSYGSRGDRTAGKYYFIGRKRADDLSCPAEQPGSGKCEAAVEPNALGLVEGTMYDIAGLTEEKIQELEEIAVTGAGADAVPAEFKILNV
ncbi:hypothetical protein FVEN_g9504 [Fusarium venenatum]|uniref:Secreted protein n=1 Tax=Fusarium venenatum TaxID=56646 RepID=A0A2L2U143_9HYPO|nr:uncharacterized protein FVRRES_04197 [Fusarium venenatum]KAG8352456.1 hypothetical protein FVEN_g9504 [Fusarium venenatum]KAH7002848.1 hypothetical protein EDB82DRAFT_469681 [Fusarium venenatum]CEI67685.1 unnamed protein product [Fusarium venenatum]